MRAWIIEEHGGPEVFKEVERPKPEPSPGQVRIKVAATSVNPVDYKIRSGAAEALCPPKPAVLHGDVSGIVDAVGQGVNWANTGDEVYGCIGGYGALQGVLADYIITRRWKVVDAPKSIPLIDAAALPLVSITAWEGWEKIGDYSGEARVLVHGATGGVGHLAIQLANARGKFVCATVGSEQKATIARKLGAHEVINYKEESMKEYVDRLTEGKGFNIIFDTVGGSNLKACIDAATFNGKIACIQGRTDIDGGALHAKGLSLNLIFMLIPLLHGITPGQHPFILTQISKLVDEGKIKPLIDNQRFTFDQIGEAHAYAESGKQLGKVLVVHPDFA